MLDSYTQYVVPAVMKTEVLKHHLADRFVQLMQVEVKLSLLHNFLFTQKQLLLNGHLNFFPASIGTRQIWVFFVLFFPSRTLPGLRSTAACPFVVSSAELFTHIFLMLILFWLVGWFICLLSRSCVSQEAMCY